ncbi:hypothetical protein AOLI_G00316420 [Acnodon oligacanthus]
MVAVCSNCSAWARFGRQCGTRTGNDELRAWLYCLRGSVRPRTRLSRSALGLGNSCFGSGSFGRSISSPRLVGEVRGIRTGFWSVHRLFISCRCLRPTRPRRRVRGVSGNGVSPVVVARLAKALPIIGTSGSRKLSRCSW